MNPDLEQRIEALRKALADLRHLGYQTGELEEAMAIIDALLAENTK